MLPHLRALRTPWLVTLGSVLALANLGTAPLFRTPAHSGTLPTPPTLTAQPLVSWAPLTTLPNAATAEPTWWAQANPAITLEAVAPTSPGARTAHWAPNIPITLSALWIGPHAGPASILFDPNASWISQHWRVDSPDGHFTVVTGGRYGGPSPGGLENATNVVQFTATRPGLYLIQGYWHGAWSMPFVLPIGINHLPVPTLAWGPAANTGVVPAPVTLLRQDPVLTSTPPSPTSTLHLGQPDAGWIPVYGTIPLQDLALGANRAIQVALTTTAPLGAHDHWNYTVPVSATGHVADWIRLPWPSTSGHFRTWVTVSLNRTAVLTTPTALTQWAHRTHRILIPYLTFPNSGPSLTPIERAHLASALMDWNQPALSPFIRTAVTLLANAPSRKIGEIAISNWLSTTIAYNFAEYHANVLTYTTALETLQKHLGICSNYVNALVTLDRAVGITAQTIDGTARYTLTHPWTATQRQNPNYAHAWVQIGTTPHAWTVDPTWNGADTLPLNSLTNAYTEATRLFIASHTTGTLHPSVFGWL